MINFGASSVLLAKAGMRYMNLIAGEKISSFSRVARLFLKIIP
jgi:hypothetical protein